MAKLSTQSTEVKTQVIKKKLAKKKAAKKQAAKKQAAKKQVAKKAAYSYRGGKKILLDKSSDEFDIR